MALDITNLVVRRIDVVFVASAVDFQCLEVQHKVVKVWLSVDAKYVGKPHGPSTQVAQDDHKQMNHLVKRASHCLFALGHPFVSHAVPGGAVVS